jgi:hypothetical protein
MGKQRTVPGAYSSDSLGKDATGPLKATEMDRERTRPKTVADGKSLADIIDTVSNECYGLSGKIGKR